MLNTDPDNELVTDEASILWWAAEGQGAVRQHAGLIVVVVDVANHLLIILKLVSICAKEDNTGQHAVHWGSKTIQLSTFEEGNKQPSQWLISCAHWNSFNFKIWELRRITINRSVWCWSGAKDFNKTIHFKHLKTGTQNHHTDQHLVNMDQKSKDIFTF